MSNSLKQGRRTVLAWARGSVCESEIARQRPEFGAASGVVAGASRDRAHV